MSNFLSKIFIFILPVVIVMYPLDYAVSKYLSQSKNFAYGEGGVWEDIYKGNINADLAIYGSSRAWIQISPKIIEDSMGISSYNLGIDGQNFHLQYLRHEALFRYNEKPKEIIISADIFSFQKKKELHNYEQFLPYLLWNNDLKKYTSSYNRFSIFDHNIPLFRYFYEKEAFTAVLKSFTKETDKPTRIKGYKGMELNWNDDLAKAKSNADYYEVAIDSSLVMLFDRFLTDCIDDGIKLTMVYTPEYIEGQNFVKNRKDIIDIYKSFSEKYNLPFIDYSKDEISMDKQYFYNALHLNKKGSELFTKKLVNDMKSLK